MQVHFFIIKWRVSAESNASKAAQLVTGPITLKSTQFWISDSNDRRQRQTNNPLARFAHSPHTHTPNALSY